MLASPNSSRPDGLDILSIRTTVLPDIPGSLAFLFSLLSNGRACQAFVSSIVPFPNVLGDLDICIAYAILNRVIDFGIPRQAVMASKI